MKSFRTKKNLAIALSVLLVAANKVKYIKMKKKKDPDIDTKMTLM